MPRIVKDPLQNKFIGKAARIVAGAAALVSTSACFGTPNPLAPNIQGSVGVPHYGVQTGAVELPRQGSGYVRYRRHSPNYWGQPRLVRTIERAAEAIATERPGGHPLVVGDLSARRGGKIPRHNSHRTGRDVDFLWYVTTPAGAPTTVPGFIEIGADGLGRDKRTGRYYRLDIPRQWLLVKTLLTDAEAEVQWIFASRNVEALIISYALATETDLNLIWHAQTVLLQPRDAQNHSDHFHVRLACLPGDALTGCEGGGPRWEWLRPLPALDLLQPAWLADLIADELPLRRAELSLDAPLDAPADARVD